MRRSEDRPRVLRGSAEHPVKAGSIQMPPGSIGIAEGVEPHRVLSVPNGNAGTALAVSIIQEALEKPVPSHQDGGRRWQRLANSPV